MVQSKIGVTLMDICKLINCIWQQQQQQQAAISLNYFLQTNISCSFLYTMLHHYAHNNISLIPFSKHTKHLKINLSLATVLYHCSFLRSLLLFLPFLLVELRLRLCWLVYRHTPLLTLCRFSSYNFDPNIIRKLNIME